MLYEVIGVAVCCVLILVVMVRISLTLNEISASLRKIARRRSEHDKLITSTVLHEEDGVVKTVEGDAEIAAAIAAAKKALEGSASSEGSDRI